MRRRAPIELLALVPGGTARQRLAPAPAAPPEVLAALEDADLGEEALYLAWQVAAWAEELDPAERGALMALVGRSLLALRQGSTRLPVSAADRALLARVPSLVGAPGERKPLLLDGGHLYHQKLLACEERLAAALAARLGRPGPFPPAEIERALAATAGGLGAEQVAAVRAALERPLAIVSGGPGTGKTTIVLALVRALARLGVPPEAIGLAAPTGKAAHRLDEAVRGRLAALPARAPEDEALLAGCPEAGTLHRLLGYAPAAGSFHHHPGNPLGHRVVIVDEGSMVDLFLMERLARALGDGAQLVLLGDEDQLPSVEAGAVFRDLAPLGVRLRQSYRMDPAGDAGRALLEVAGRVKAGDGAALGTLVAERAGAGAVAFSGAERVPPAAREELLERWYAERIAGPALDAVADATWPLRGGALDPADEPRVAALFSRQQAARILCVTRARPTGVEAANAWLHRRHGGTGGGFLPGEPVMMLRNDYDRGLFNGDQGLVLRAREPGGAVRLCAAFPAGDRFAVFDLDGLRATLALSYALTVHKAQGSEYEDVLLLLPEAPLPLLARELLYTALTRSRRSVVICGSAAVLAAAVAARLERSSGLRDRLGAPARADGHPAGPAT